MVSGLWFILGCAVVAVAIAMWGAIHQPPSWLLPTEVFATVIGLFAFGSGRYRIGKNPLTYGAALIILATFFSVWRHGEGAVEMRNAVAAQGWTAWVGPIRENLLTFHGLDRLIHLDTMLFILGLTFFVAVIAQTRLLESLTFILLRRCGGRVLPTVLAVTAVVSFASGILDGVSMIGLTIRTLVIVLALAAAPTETVRYAVLVCTVVTTACGMWLAYGEPPNLIMKANVVDAAGRHILDDRFFLVYCLPAAVLCYAIVAASLRKKLGGKAIVLGEMDILDANAASVRFMQAQRHGEVYSPEEFIEHHEGDLGPHFPAALEQVRRGASLGLALVRAGVPREMCVKLLGRFTSEELGDVLADHYEGAQRGFDPAIDPGEAAVQVAIDAQRSSRLRAARIGALALLPFVALLIAHAVNHSVPLFLASFAGFAVAFMGVRSIPRMRKLALHEAREEFAEYYFLLPLFLSITLLSRVGFFDTLKAALHEGIEAWGTSHMAFVQFAGATLLSAVLDNNVVADFASRAIAGLDPATTHLFSMAQIAGYAIGGCLTHIGSVQSVVAYAFILRTIDARFTPMQWIREMAPLVLKLFIGLTLLTYATALARSF